MASEQKRLRAGVVGAGVFGGFHASKYAAHPRADLVGIYEPDAEKARALADKHGAKPYDNLARLIEDCEAVTVASPAVHHFEAAAAALAQNRHVLVEKPIASSVEEARELIGLAAIEAVIQLTAQVHYLTVATREHTAALERARDSSQQP